MHSNHFFLPELESSSEDDDNEQSSDDFRRDVDFGQSMTTSNEICRRRRYVYLDIDRQLSARIAHKEKDGVGTSYSMNSLNSTGKLSKFRSSSTKKLPIV